MSNFNFTIRDLHCNDYRNNYLNLLHQDFTINPSNILFSDFTDYVNKLDSSHKIFIIEYLNLDEPENNQTMIIGTATILIETKIIHNFGKVGHIEDVIVDNTFRGKGLGKLLIQKCIEYAKSCDCYKVILNCSDENINFYTKCGFIKKENEMVIYC